jgi:hypothetical protein
LMFKSKRLLTNNMSLSISQNKMRKREEKMTSEKKYLLNSIKRETQPVR